MLEKLSNYIVDREFRLTLFKDMVNVINYSKIISLEENYISIIANEKKILIKGNNLVLKKILDNELLIKGIINSIEVVNE